MTIFSTSARTLRSLPLGACFAFVALASATTATWTTAAHADDVADEADLQFRLAAEGYQAGDYRRALEHFLASNRLAPNRNVLFNIARCFEALKEYPDAYRYYVRALQAETEAGARSRIDEAMKRMAPNVAILKVVTDPPGATLYIDRKDLGQRGAGPQTFGLAPGTFKIIAEAPGYEDAVSQPTAVQAGGTATVSLSLVRILGTVHVAGNEATGAQVRIDNEDSPVVCTAPCDLQLPPGRHTLYASREGFKTFVTLVDVIAKKAITTRPSIEAKTGSLMVSTDEPGATVEIDGFPRGPTPLLLTLPVGAHAVRVTMRGFRPIVQSVQIDPNTDTRLANLSLIPVEEVEAASRVAESVEDAPASVTIISAQELRGMAYPTVYQALEGVRGVYLSDNREYDSVGFRGFGSPGDYGSRTLVLLNGQPTNDNWVWSSYIGYDFRTDLEDVQRIEVIRGPGSVLYGTGAVSGVINIVTRPHDAQQGLEVGASTADGTVGRGRVRAAYNFGDNAGIWTSVQASHSSGNAYYFPEFASDTFTHGNTPASADRFNAGTWTGQFWWKALTAQWSLNTHNKHLPTGEYDTILGDDRTRQRDTRGVLEVKFEPKLGSVFQSLTRAHANYYGFNAYFASVPEEGGDGRGGFTGIWAGLEERLVFTPAKPVRITVGGEFQNHFKADQFAANEFPNTVPYLDDHHSFQIAAGYAVADLTPTRAIKLSIGGRYDEYSNLAATSFSSFNPRVALILKPGERENIKIMFGKAFRAPAIYELYWADPGVQNGSPDLRPESMYSAEIEYSHRFTPTVVGLVTGYENVLSNGIVLGNATATACPACLVYSNTSTPVGTMGAEAELRKEWEKGWMASANYSFAHSVYLEDGSLNSIVTLAKDPARRHVPNAPENMASVRAGAPILGRALMATTRLSYAGGRYDVNDTQSTASAPTPPQTETSPAVIWDIVLNGQESRFNIRYSVGVYNAFNWKYAVPVSTEFTQPNGTALLSVPQNGRTGMAAAYFNF